MEFCALNPGDRTMILRPRRFAVSVADGLCGAVAAMSIASAASPPCALSPVPHLSRLRSLVQPGGTMCRREDLRPGAYVVDTTTRRMYEVGLDGPRVTSLVDCNSPIDEPHSVEFLTSNAVTRMQLVQPAPCLEDVASVEEFGGYGVQPT